MHGLTLENYLGDFKKLSRIAVCLAVIVCGSLHADDSPEIYIYYLHGRIIEEQGRTPTHSKFGLYNYPAIIEALGSRGATVISEARPPGTRAGKYAEKTVAEIEKLVSDGVSPGQIVVIGFSKGGNIAIRVSNLIKNPEIRYVLLATCAEWLVANEEVNFTGHLLSIFETSDDLAKSCKDFSERGDEVVSYQEITLSTGKGHGAFYLPNPLWVTPVLDWVHDNKDNSENSIE
jgi:hypothetical protein